MIRIGQGYDVHRLVSGRKLVLGGVTIAHDKGLLGHSDADVVLHALCDALLGAASLGDIGQHFSDQDPQFENCDSRIFLRHIQQLLTEKSYQINNIDITIIAEQPKLINYKGQMIANIAQDLLIDQGQINIKATTHEQLGSLGREEGIAALAVALLENSL